MACCTPPQHSSCKPRAHLPRRHYARWQSGQPHGWMCFLQLLNMISEGKEAVIWGEDNQYKFRTIIVLIDHFLKCYLAPAQHWNACLLKVAWSRRYALPEILSTLIWKYKNYVKQIFTISAEPSQCLPPKVCFSIYSLKAGIKKYGPGL